MDKTLDKRLSLGYDVVMVERTNGRERGENPLEQLTTQSLRLLPYQSQTYQSNNMQLDFTGGNLREHPLLGDFFSNIRGSERWQMMSLNDSAMYDLGEFMGDTLEELLGVDLSQLGFLCRFDEDGILEQAFPPKVFKGEDGLVLKFGEAELLLISMLTEINGRQVLAIVNDAMQFALHGSKATAFLTESTNEDRTNVNLTVSMQSAGGQRLRLSAPVAIEQGATKLSIEDCLAYGAGDLLVKPIPTGSAPTEGAFLISRGSSAYEDLKYPPLAGKKNVDAAIIEATENTASEYGGFFLKVQDSSGLTWTVFSNSSLAKQLKNYVYLDEAEVKRLNLEDETESLPGITKSAVRKWHVINACPGKYCLRVKPEREYGSGKYTADTILFEGEPNPEFALTPVRVAERMALVGSADQPQLKSAAVEAEVVH